MLVTFSIFCIKIIITSWLIMKKPTCCFCCLTRQFYPPSNSKRQWRIFQKLIGIYYTSITWREVNNKYFANIIILMYQCVSICSVNSSLQNTNANVNTNTSRAYYQNMHGLRTKTSILYHMNFKNCRPWHNRKMKIHKFICHRFCCIPVLKSGMLKPF